MDNANVKVVSLFCSVSLVKTITLNLTDGIHSGGTSVAGQV